ncbi:branched-chain amino acid ABC transporter permease [Butyrivibrio sp. NC3005]|uniref:branched-chain amino acid ABC transporter permease n=1 Tax=Butyrivibrio sp. NC3005 TaxID=1280685 RepID=UPI0004283880|nr:branched-chain amino acid ABC transporter permease [Butyrivibrio sp. NC3005]
MKDENKKSKMLSIVKEKKASDISTYIIVATAWAVFEILIANGMISSHMKGLLVPMVYYAIAAVGLNLCVGILGELSIGHAGFMCVGAFTSVMFSNIFAETFPAPVRFFLAMMCGIAFAALFGFLIGIPVLRLNGDYLAIVTLAFGEIIKNVINALYLGYDKEGVHASLSAPVVLDAETGKMLINGPLGVTGTPRDANFSVSIVVLLISLFIVQNLMKSRDGRAIMAIRDNRIAAESIGINVTKFKIYAFTISAAIAGAAGVLFGHSISTLQSTSGNFGYNISILILVYVVLGGIGNIKGSIIAAAVLYLLPELLRGLSSYRMLIYSIVLIVMMLFNWAPSVRDFRSSMWMKIRRRKEN